MTGADAVVDDAENSAEATGRRIGNALASPFIALWAIIGGIGSQIAYLFTRFLPFFGAMWWKGMVMMSLKFYHKRSGGDALGLMGNEHANKARFKPVKWKDHSQTNDDEQPGWKIKGEDRTYEDSHHDAVFRIGNVPVVLINEDETRAGSWLEANVTEAIDAGNMREVYDVSKADLSATIEYGDALGGQQAVADGGANVTREFNPKESPVFADMFIDPTSDDGFFGRAISWMKYVDHDPTTTSPEEIDRAEQRGWLAGLAGQDDRSFIIKVLLIAAGIALGGIALVTVVPQLLSGSGGGGGIVPFAMDAARFAIGA